MSISIVQVSTPASTDGTPGGCTFGTGVTAGNYLLVFATEYNPGSGFPSTPTLGGTDYPSAQTTVLAEIGNSSKAATIAWLLTDIPSGMAAATAFSFSASSGAGRIASFAIEFSAVNPKLDLYTTAIGSSSTGPDMSLGPTNHPGELAAGLIGIYSGSYALTTGNGWTSVMDSGNYATGGYQTVANSGTDLTFSVSNSSGSGWAAVLVSVYDDDVPASGLLMTGII